MSTGEADRTAGDTPESWAWNSLCQIGGIVAFLQLGLSLVTMGVVVVLGGEPGTPGEYFEVLNGNRLTGLLRLDFASMVNVSLYLFTFFGLYAALRRTREGPLVALATGLASVGVTLWLGKHSALSMIHLSDLYAAASTDAAKSQLLAAGEAVIASDMWRSSGALMGAILIEGAAVLISVVMLKGSLFTRATAYAGILTHGIELLRIPVGLFSAGAANILMILAGPIYLIWFPLLGRDLLRVGTRSHNDLKTGT